MQIQYYNELFDPKFYAEFEFVVEILSPPTHFEKKKRFKKIAWANFKNFYCIESEIKFRVK